MENGNLLQPLNRDEIVTWLHFGDLHITRETEANYRDLLLLIEEANNTFSTGVSFAVLPGDNADDGTEAQYRLVCAALDKLSLPLYILPGDHDKKSGSLDLFHRYLEPEPRQAFTLGAYRFVFLNSLDSPAEGEFDFGPEQLSWLEQELCEAERTQLTSVLFMHTYPSELTHASPSIKQSIRTHRVLLVEMGHTHYNELANDGTTIYAATRSTGQIEEGPVGLSVTSVDRGVVSWKFKPLGDSPFVSITSPADCRLIVDRQSANQVVRGPVTIRARVWGCPTSSIVAAHWDNRYAVRMQPSPQPNTWHCEWDSTELRDGEHRLQVTVVLDGAIVGQDRISVCVNQAGNYTAPRFHERDMDNSIGAYPSKGILGTQLGPNKNGRKW